MVIQKSIDIANIYSACICCKYAYRMHINVLTACNQIISIEECQHADSKNDRYCESVCPALAERGLDVTLQTCLRDFAAGVAGTLHPASSSPPRPASDLTRQR